jgi:hypothetical protein
MGPRQQTQGIIAHEGSRHLTEQAVKVAGKPSLERRSRWQIARAAQ